MDSSICSIVGNALGITIAVVAGLLVYRDAQAWRDDEIASGGQSTVQPALWGIGVAALLIVFLPWYLIVRQRKRGYAMEWHVHINGNQSGPHPESAAVAWAQSGQLRPTDLVWSTGMTDWVPAGQTQPFAGAFAGMPVAAAAPRRLGDDAAMRAILPVGRSGWAIAAGYLGLFSVLVFPAPFALLTGIMAIVDIRRDEHKHGMGRAIFGIVMGTLFTVILIGLLATAGR